MNVRCPTCQSVYRVDPARVPEAGIKARCASCSTVLAISRTADAAMAAAPPAAAPSPPPARPSAPSPAPARRSEPTPPPAAPAPSPRAPRMTRPFARAPGLEAAPPPAPAMPPSASPPSRPSSRPSAPVFRPAPAAPARPVAPPRAPTPQAPAAPPPSAPARHSEAKAVNPFLAQDPRQKARRLARALVSDMIVYQPEKRQQALKAGNVKDVFEEEIKKSWVEYVHQVGAEMADSTPYWAEALNEILAGGQKVF